MEDYITRNEFEQFKSQVQQQEHNGFDGQLINIQYVQGLFRTITDSTELTRTLDTTARVPNSFAEQLLIDTTTGTKKLYVYDSVGKVWRSCTIA